MTDDREDQQAISEGANEDIQESALPLIDLETEGQRPPSRRKRAAQIGLALTAAAVVLVTFWQVAFPARPAPPVPKPFPPPLLLITSNVNYGILTINGKRQQAKLPFLFQAQNTPYTITLEPVPLRPHSCHFSFSSGGLNMPDQSQCFGGPASYQLPNGALSPHNRSYALEMYFNAHDLPPGHVDQIDALLSQQSNVEQTITIPAGAYYATSFAPDGSVSSQRATAALQGTATRLSRLNQPDFSCDHLICPADLDWNSLSQLTGQVWIISFPVALRWQFATQSGSVLSDVAYPIAAYPDAFLTYDTKTGWSIQPEARVPTLTPIDQMGNLDCATGTMLVQQLLQQDTFSFDTPYHQRLSGCEIVPRNNGVYQGKLLWRFGVLLAGDAPAHTLLPNLPLAPPEEIAAVEQGAGG